jgi:hypothetical protein
LLGLLGSSNKAKPDACVGATDSVEDERQPLPGDGQIRAALHVSHLDVHTPMMRLPGRLTMGGAFRLTFRRGLCARDAGQPERYDIQSFSSRPQNTQHETSSEQ